jgi:hypothetical protein
MPTAATAVIREEDVLRYKGDDGNLGGVGSNLMGRINLQVLLPNTDNTNFTRLVTIMDGVDATQRVATYGNPTGDYITSLTQVGAVQSNSSPAVDTYDGKIHTANTRWKTNYLLGHVDSTDGAVVSSVLVPDDLDNIEIGVALGIGQPNGVISDIEIYDRDRRD